MSVTEPQSVAETPETPRRARVKSIEIQGYKSLADQTIELRDLNVLIGANGSGKSNFLSVFKLLRAIGISSESNNLFPEAVAKQGGAAAILRYGPAVTEECRVVVRLGHGNEELSYDSRWKPAPGDQLLFKSEQVAYPIPASGIGKNWDQLATSSLNSMLPWYREKCQDVYRAGVIYHWLQRDLSLHHMDDTSLTSPLKRGVSELHQDSRLLPGGDNLPTMLQRYQEQYPEVYRNIVETIRMMFPQFGSFVLEPQPGNSQRVRMRWREQGQENEFGVYQLSDGTLRVMALATVLLQPEEEMPGLIIIDEPELGLHPHAIPILSAMIHRASRYSQVIVATQSLDLLDQFDADEILTVSRPGIDFQEAAPVSRQEYQSRVQRQESVVQRLNKDKLAGWIKEYSLSDIVRMNVMGGIP